MPDIEIDAKEIEQFQADLDKARKNLATEQRRAFKEIGTQAAAWSRAKARAGTPMQRRYASYIKGSATQNNATILVPRRRASNDRSAGAAVAFFGARPLTRTGWNAAVYDRSGNRLRGRRRLPGARSQFPAWVGNTWIAGRRGEGPYAINDALAEHRRDIDQMIEAAYKRATSKAFPEGG